MNCLYAKLLWLSRPFRTFEREGASFAEGREEIFDKKQTNRKQTMSEASQETVAQDKDSAWMRLTRWFDDTTHTVIVAIVIAMTIRMFLFEPFNIPSSSMVPTLLVGDYLFVSKYSYGYSSRSTVWGLLPVGGRVFMTEPKRGDVVVFKWPDDNSTDYIKRLVGLPGDKIQVRHGLLYVNGVPVNRKKIDGYVASNYLTPPASSTDYEETLPNNYEHVIRELGDDFQTDETEEFEVPPHHYFMMGDNRDNSQDSRVWRHSFVPEENLIGRAERLFFSLDEHSHFWEFWKWPWAIRWSRIGMRIT